MFCAPKPVSNGTEGVRSSFPALCSRTHFLRYRRRRVPFSCFKLQDFSCLLSRTHFWLYRGRRVPFSCFALLDSFSAESTALGPVFIFCAHGLIFGGIWGIGSRFHVFAPGPVSDGTEGVGSRFHVLLFQTHFRRYRRCWVSFSCFALPDSFSGLSGAKGPISCFAFLDLFFDGTEGVGSLFYGLLLRTRFRRYRRRRVQFSYFALPNPFSAVPTASVPVFMFCAPVHIFGSTVCVESHFHLLRSRTVFGGTDGVGSRYIVLRSRTHFRRYRGCRSRFHVLRSRTHFRRYQGRLVPFFMFCAPGLIFDGTEGVGSRVSVLRSRTYFRWYRGHRVPFSAVPRASCPVFMFGAP
jgi:hypothetical protein